MKIYKVTYIRNGDEGNQFRKNVGAESVDQAASDAKRNLERNTYSTVEVVRVEKILDVDIFYKSKSKKKK